MRFHILMLTLAFSTLALVGPGVAATPAASDLAVSATDSPDPVLAGTPLGYAIQVRNLGPDQATKVRLTVRLPRGADLVSATPSTGSCGPVKGGKLSCDLGSLSAPVGIDYSGSPTVSVVLIPRRVGANTATARVNGHEKDPVAANDRVTLTTLVTAPVSCRGRTATIVGTVGDDVLDGTSGPDVIVGFAGNDTIRASAGRDLICAGRGNDRVVAGTAADRVFGGSGRDVIFGRGGPDVLKGNAGNDVLRGNRGSDRLFGQRGRRDLCRGGPGRDRLRGCEHGAR